MYPEFRCFVVGIFMVLREIGGKFGKLFSVNEAIDASLTFLILVIALNHF